MLSALKISACLVFSNSWLKAVRKYVVGGFISGQIHVFWEKKIAS
jgi:hypothetical protein